MFHPYNFLQIYNHKNEKKNLQKERLEVGEESKGSLWLIS